MPSQHSALNTPVHVRLFGELVAAVEEKLEAEGGPATGRTKTHLVEHAFTEYRAGRFNLPDPSPVPAAEGEAEGSAGGDTPRADPDADTRPDPAWARARHPHEAEEAWPQPVEDADIPDAATHSFGPEVTRDPDGGDGVGAGAAILCPFGCGYLAVDREDLDEHVDLAGHPVRT